VLFRSIVFLELIIDPACSVVFEAEPEEANIMRRRPRDPAKPLFGRSLIVLGLVQGLSVLAIVLAVCGLALLSGRSETQVRTLTFTTLVFANLGLILANRSWSRVIVTSLRSPNPALWWVFGLATAFLGVVLYQPAVRRLFRFSPLQPAELLLCLAGGLASIVWFELMKMVNRPERSSRGGSIR
jgi:P-type Ca2+ transporter type 2C